LQTNDWYPPNPKGDSTFGSGAFYSAVIESPYERTAVATYWQISVQFKRGLEKASKDLRAVPCHANIDSLMSPAKPE